MSAAEQKRGRTRPVVEDSDSDDDEVNVPSSTEYSESVKGKFRGGRIDESSAAAAFPTKPLYAKDEIVYLLAPNQQYPSGPFVVVSIDTANRYTIKRLDNNQLHPQPVNENSLVVPV
ncbi:hypothetical protein P154DRAFT_621240 [Amniculicola lignicola CBS 123094]|uniref:Uncharacterized protein n=1 Tax=Amniculicola lignicola CBS 123094 TaxID=1392246 RepID=A0A6A5WDT7_9PLEO|nr:hypothetical protein P154DRAFT_621240 [Amniculicola lignicola CBS 123094]